MQTQQLRRVHDRGEGVAQFVAEHRQELVLAARFVGQLSGLFGDPLLHRHALGDIANVALSDEPLLLVIDVGDHFDLDLLAALLPERQVLVTEILGPPQLAQGFLALVNIVEHADLMQFLAQQVGAIATGEIGR